LEAKESGGNVAREGSGKGAVTPPLKICDYYSYHDDVKGLQHYIDHLKITFSVLLQCNSDVFFPILGYGQLSGAKISWPIGGGPL